MASSKIEWTDCTWNPVTGCSKVSAGCANCYAQRMSKRLKAMGQAKYAAGFDEVVCHPDELDKPLHWKKPRKIFVNSMSDLFHEDVPFEFAAAVFAVMGLAGEHDFQVLTKRPERLAEFCEWQADKKLSSFLADYVLQPNGWSWDAVCNNLDGPCGRQRPLANVWLGTSIENQAAVKRIEHLVRCPAAVRFLSLEPLLRPIHHLPLSGIDWVIVGCETGPGARPCKLEWVRSLVQQCRSADVPVFIKQLNAHRCRCGHVYIAGVPVGRPGWDDVCRKCYLHESRMTRCVSKDPAEWPEDLRHHEWPKGA